MLSAVAEALQADGIESAVVEIRGGSLQPLVYVIPADCDDGMHVAWYSEGHSPSGRAEIQSLTFTYGRRDGEPFLHCHGSWRLGDGSVGGGHLMPHEAQFSEAVEGEVFALSGAILDQLDDGETNFRLFTPLPLCGHPNGDGTRAVLCRVKPNEEIHSAIERTAREHGFKRATLHGVGSFVGCDFADGRHMPGKALEVFIRDGSLQELDGRTCSRLDVAAVDAAGAVLEGEITHGNAVCVTFELLIVEA